MEHKIKLSICMMVKNEEKYLEQSLSSLESLLDKVESELIIVDTGSKDRTIEIARQYTRKVYFHDWNNDFASMRNKTISYATGEWILVLDGDEIFEDTSNLVKFLNSSISKKYNAGMITIKSIIREDNDDVSGLVDMIRLFRNTKKFHYKGVIHEQPQYQEPIFGIDAVVLHYGYLATDKDLMELKFKRNTTLLEQELEKDPENIYYWFQLSQSYGMYKDYKKALEINIKAYEIAKKNNINLKDRMYIYTHLARLYYLNQEYQEVENICLEALGIEDDYIDLYYYLGKAQKSLNKDENSIESYKKYLVILDNYQKSKVVKGASISKSTLEFYEDVYLDLCDLYQRIGNKEEALKYAKKINKKYMIREIIPNLIKLHIDLERYEDLKSNYIQMTNNNEQIRDYYCISLEKAMVNLDEYEKYRLIELFSIDDSSYALLNKIRLYINQNKDSIDNELIYKVRNLNFKALPVFFADIIYFFLDRNILVGEILHNLREYDMQAYIEFLANKYDNLSEVMIGYLKNVQENRNFCEMRFQKVLRRNLLILNKVDMEQFRYTWDKYIEDGIYYINEIYNEEIIEKERVYDVKDNEDCFFIYMLLSERSKIENKVRYVRYLRKALNIYPNMKKGIEILIEELKQENLTKELIKLEDLTSKENKRDSVTIDSQDFERYKDEVKNNIKSFVENGMLEESKELIKEYERIVKDDIDIYSIKGVIAMIEGNMYDAEAVLLEGLNIDSLNCDILYNLGYIYETQRKYITAYRYYKKIVRISDDKVAKDSIYKIRELERLKNVREYLERKKVLFIAHIFPPVGGSGVQRSLKFVKYLREFGWEPIVVTVGETIYPLRDETMVSEIPEEVEIIRISERKNIDQFYTNQLIQLYSGLVNNNKLIEEYIKKLNRSREQINHYLLLPDTYIIWATEVLDKISEKLNFTDIDVIYTTSGPYSDHVIGYYLKQKYNKPWVADFRDEWTNNPYANFDKNDILYKISFAMEKNIVSFADRILTVTPISTENYIEIFDVNGHKIKTITNGYDELDFINIQKKKNKNKKFTIMHNGMLYLIRTPFTFMKAIQNLIDNGDIKRSEIKVIFGYTENLDKWIEIRDDLGLNDVVEFLDYMTHEESLRKANDVDALLLIVGEGKKNKSVYPGKVFEYMRLFKPIIALSPKGSIVEQLINVTKRGKNVDFNDIKGISDRILEMYKDWENDLIQDYDVTDNIIRYERKYLTEQLSQAFLEVFNEYDPKLEDVILEKSSDFYDKLFEDGGWNQTYFKHYS